MTDEKMKQEDLRKELAEIKRAIGWCVQYNKRHVCPYLESLGEDKVIKSSTEVCKECGHSHPGGTCLDS